MYNVTRILGKLRAQGSLMKPVDLNTSIDVLLNDYSKCLIELSHPSTTDVLKVTTDDITEMFLSSDRSLTLPEWLASIGDTALPTETGPWVISKEIVKQSDLLSTDFRIQYVDSNGNYSDQMTDDVMTDISLKRPDIDYLEIFQHCLFSVNGLLHIADASEQGIYITDAGKSTRHENTVQISALSFYNIGKVETIPISPDMIFRGSVNSYRSGFSIKVPRDLTNKTVMLSIAGFLHHVDDCFKVSGVDTISIDWSKIPVAARYFDSVDKIDWSVFTEVCERSGMVDDLVISETAASEDEAILSILQMSQSFIILIDAVDLFYDHRYLEKTGLPGRYQSDTKPVGPVRTNQGYLHPYKVRQVAGTYWITMCSNWAQNRIVDYTNRHVTKIYRNGSISQDPKYLSPGQEMLIGMEVYK